MSALPHHDQLHALRAQLGEIIIGQGDLLDRLAIAMLAGGHVLLEGPPGLAKTTAVHALASAIDASYQRVQFTPDLLPGDLTGSDIYDSSTGELRFIAGPIFHEILLADEINRAPPKVQSALLEAMAEHQVTAGGTTHPLPDLFMVLATQNPLEHSGTYPLPEAQLDRFLFQLIIDYPSVEEEIEISRRARRATEGHVEADVRARMTPGSLLEARAALNHIHIDERVERYAVELVVATRDPGARLAEWQDMVLAGASPRASISLLRAGTAMAALEGRDFVLPEDVRALAPDVLRHRIVLDHAAYTQKKTTDDLVTALLASVPAP